MQTNITPCKTTNIATIKIARNDLRDRQTILFSLTNCDVESQLKIKCLEERRLTIEIIELLEELDRRKIYLERGYSSLIEYCVRVLKYSEGSAYRRVSAMRLTREVPEIKSKIVSGDTNVVNLAKLQTFFKAEIKNKKFYSKAQKVDLMVKVSNLSTRQVEKTLVDISPEVSGLFSHKIEKVKSLDSRLTRISIVVDETLLCKLDRLKDFLSYQLPVMSYVSLIDLLANKAIKDIEKKNGIVI